MENKSQHFISCFICGVEVKDNRIILIDSGHQKYIVYKDSKDVVAEFKDWFENVYLNCIPQSLTVIRYDIVEKNEYEAELVVKKMIYKKNGENK